MRHFLTLLDFTPEELRTVVLRAIELKSMSRYDHAPLTRRVLAMVFEKSSTRTRVSFETAMVQLGGQAIFLSPNETQLGRGEDAADTARVISSMVDAIMVRTHGHDRLESFAQDAGVPVINGLTDRFHPCQLLADVQTFWEKRGSIAGKRVAWIGDGNNMCNSYINAAKQFDFELRIAAPIGYQPEAALLDASEARVDLSADPKRAVQGADLVVTDVWASMGQEGQADERAEAFAPFQVNETLLAAAATDVLFMHCLPAHRGEEISETLLDHPASVVWDEAENRLHAQKALLEFLIDGSSP